MMIKFLSIKKIKDMWETLNSKKDSKGNEEEKSNKKHEEYLEIMNKEEHDFVEKQWKYLQERRKNMPPSIKISGQKSNEESIKMYQSNLQPVLKIPEEMPKPFGLDTEETTAQTTTQTTNVTSNETTSEANVENKNNTNLEALIKDLISQVSELKKEISELKSSKQSTLHTTTNTIQRGTLRPEDDADLFIRNYYGKSAVDTKNVLNKVLSNDKSILSSSIESSSEPCSDKVTKNVEDIPTNISKLLEIHQETGFDEEFSPDLKVEKSSKILEKNIENFTTYPDIFTDDLPDLDKIPGELVLNSLLKGSTQTAAEQEQEGKTKRHEKEISRNKEI
jgi:hypothetical protein